LVDLISVVRASITQNDVLARKRRQTIHLTSEEYDYMPVFADSSRLGQVFGNILSNAVKYSGDGTQIEVHIRREGEFYAVAVTDQGMGIPKADLDKIFDRFYRVDKARSRDLGGTGLGLSIAKEIVVAHGGRITAESRLGKGTTMTVRLRAETSD
jgi:two-component system sensor histidine kinase VicK